MPKTEAKNITIDLKAPEIILKTQHDNEFKLSDYFGKKNVVIYFYPKDKTPGCTIQAGRFESLIEDFESVDTIIVGISQDTVESHKSFAESKKLNFILLSDIKGDFVKQYDSFESGIFSNIARNTFFVGKDGKVKKIWYNVSVFKNPEETLDFAKQFYNLEHNT